MLPKILIKNTGFPHAVFGEIGSKRKEKYKTGVTHSGKTTKKIDLKPTVG